MSVAIGPRTDVEEYRMRGSARYKGDLVHHHTRRIGSTEYDFSRVEWGNGEVSVTVWLAGTTVAVHKFDGWRE
jgi:hypothetical protein